MADAEAQPSSGKSKARSAINLHMVHFTKATQVKTTVVLQRIP